MADRLVWDAGDAAGQTPGNTDSWGGFRPSGVSASRSLRLEALQKDGTVMRAAMGEVLVMRGGLICERRAYVVPLTENDYR